MHKNYNLELQQLGIKFLETTKFCLEDTDNLEMHSVLAQLMIKQNEVCTEQEYELMVHLLKSNMQSNQILDSVQQFVVLNIQNAFATEIMHKLRLQYVDLLYRQLFILHLPVPLFKNIPAIFDLSPACKKVIFFMRHIRSQPNYSEVYSDSLISLMNQYTAQIVQLDFRDPLPIYQINQLEVIFNSTFNYVQKLLLQNQIEINEFFNIKAATPQEFKFNFMRYLLNKQQPTVEQQPVKKMSELKLNVTRSRQNLQQQIISNKITFSVKELDQLLIKRNFLNSLQFSAHELHQYQELVQASSKVNDIYLRFNQVLNQFKQIQVPKQIYIQNFYFAQTVNQMLSFFNIALNTKDIQQIFDQIHEETQQYNKLVQLIHLMDYHVALLTEFVNNIPLYTNNKNEMTQMITVSFHELKNCVEDYRGRWGVL
ncbi:Hypothetical_protein [Hexamita inflata]|uniref:Hypothetical_protein n=1 Tax=Hexamita inflata TaxID=28002 RepID=A0AA86R2X7_9EUKA|nr:Hypothetical protein HINF_LOCUS55872 [Hexamita inflata]